MPLALLALADPPDSRPQHLSQTPSMFRSATRPATLTRSRSWPPLRAEPVFQRQIVRILLMVPVYSSTSLTSLFISATKAQWVITIRWARAGAPTSRKPRARVVRDPPRPGCPRRSCYEAYVIYCFLQLCIEYLGGPGHLVNKLEGHSFRTSLFSCTCCCGSEVAVSSRFLLWVKRGVIQFVWIKPAMALVQLIMVSQGTYGGESMSPHYAHFWVVIIYNISYTRASACPPAPLCPGLPGLDRTDPLPAPLPAVALYSLAMFYFGTHDVLHDFKPFLKFVMIKLVIFLSFWQEIIFSMLVRGWHTRSPPGMAPCRVATSSAAAPFATKSAGCSSAPVAPVAPITAPQESMGFLKSASLKSDIENLLICIEMAFAVVGMWFAFPYSDYTVPGVKGAPIIKALANVGHAVSVQDLVTDTVHNFAPSYQDYVLYSTDGHKKIHRVRTFVTVGGQRRANAALLGHQVRSDAIPEDVEWGARNPSQATSLFAGASTSTAGPVSMGVLELTKEKLGRKGDKPGAKRTLNGMGLEGPGAPGIAGGMSRATLLAAAPDEHRGGDSGPSTADGTASAAAVELAVVPAVAGPSESGGGVDARLAPASAAVGEEGSGVEPPPPPLPQDGTTPASS